MKKLTAILIVQLIFLATGGAQVLLPAKPETVGMSAERLTRIDQVVQEYVKNEWIPGAVVLIARNGKIVYHKAFGSYV